MNVTCQPIYRPFYFCGLISTNGKAHIGSSSRRGCRFQTGTLSGQQQQQRPAGRHRGSRWVAGHPPGSMRSWPVKTVLGRMQMRAFSNGPTGFVQRPLAFDSTTQRQNQQQQQQQQQVGRAARAGNTSAAWQLSGAFTRFDRRVSLSRLLEF